MDESAEASYDPAKDESGSARTKVKRANCPVCKHPDRVDIYDAYVGWHMLPEINKRFGLAPGVLAAHLEHRAQWSRQREANRRQMLVKLIEYGLDNLDSLGLKGRDVINAIQWLDKLDGLVIDRKEINGPPTVNILAIPRPGGILNKPSQTQEELAAGPVVASYPRLRAPSEPEREFAHDTGKKEGTNEG